MRTETKVYLGDYAKFRAHTMRSHVDEPSVISTWAVDPSTGSIIIEMSPEHAREWAEVLLTSARVAEEEDKELNV